MRMRRTGLVALGLAALGCTRSFNAPPPPQTLPPRIALAAPVGFADGGGAVLQLGDGGGVPVVRGWIRVHVLDAGGGPASRVDIWTPGEPHEDADAEGNWDVATGEIWPVGGVMTIYATPFDRNGTAAAAFQASYIVDNAPPQVVVMSPRPGTALAPGPVPLVFCASDRPGVTSIKLELHRIPDADGGDEIFDDGGSSYGFQGDGRCYRSQEIDAEPNGRSLVALDIVATDDVGNTAHTRVEYPVSRVVGEGLLPGVPGFTGRDIAPAVAFGPAYGVNLSLDPTMSRASVESWIDADGIRSRIVDGAVTQELAVPGSALAFVEIDATQPAQPTLRRVSMGEDGGVHVDDGGPAPQSWGRPAWDQLAHGTGARMACVAPSIYAEPLDGGTLLCFLADGGTLSADLPMLGTGGDDRLDALLILQHQVVLHVSSTAPADAGVTSLLARYDVEAGLHHLADTPTDASLKSATCVSTYSGATCEGDLGPTGFPRGPSVHLDGATGELDFYDATSLPFTHALGATPNGGLLAAFPRPAVGQQDLRELFPDGGSNLLGCTSIGASSITARFDAFHHLYVAYTDDLHFEPVVLAFAPDAGLAWSYSGQPLPAPNTEALGLTFDPLANPADPASTLLVSLGDRNAYAILSRLDPASGPRALCRP